MDVYSYIIWEPLESLQKATRIVIVVYRRSNPHIYEGCSESNANDILETTMETVLLIPKLNKSIIYLANLQRRCIFFFTGHILHVFERGTP